jgi:hypothetical protein
MRDTSYFLVTITQENCKNFSLLNIDAKLVWLLNNENIDIFENEIKVLLMANVHGGNLHHPDTDNNFSSLYS